jgi:hypothetical protein
MRRSRWALATAALAVPAAVTVMTTPPARADCLSASVWVDREQAPTTYLLGPDYCVTPTPWGVTVDAGKDNQGGGSPFQPGDPTGGGAGVKVPTP